MNTLQDLIDKIDTYEFECEAGPLHNCVDWQKLKVAVLLQSQKVVPVSRFYPCGCVLCICDSDESCSGCGAKNCGKSDAECDYKQQQIRKALSEQVVPEGWVVVSANVLADALDGVGNCQWDARSKVRELYKSAQGEQKCASKLYPWYLTDKYGWPIEFISGRSKFYRFVRIVCQNIRKITG